MANENGNETNVMPSKLQFHYKKSKFFRVIHADGVIGNITPKNDIFVSFYNERSPLPDVISFEVTADGEVGEEIEEDREFKTSGILREMEVGVVIDIDFARSLVLWLTNLIQQTENREIVSNNSEGEDNEVRTIQ